MLTKLFPIPKQKADLECVLDNKHPTHSHSDVNDAENVRHDYKLPFSGSASQKKESQLAECITNQTTATSDGRKWSVSTIKHVLLVVYRSPEVQLKTLMFF